MIEKGLYARRLDFIAIGAGFAEIIGSLRCLFDVITVSRTVNAALNVVEGGIETLR